MPFAPHRGRLPRKMVENRTNLSLDAAKTFQTTDAGIKVTKNLPYNYKNGRADYCGCTFLLALALLALDKLFIAAFLRHTSKIRCLHLQLCVKMHAHLLGEARPFIFRETFSMRSKMYPAIVE